MRDETKQNINRIAHDAQSVGQYLDLATRNVERMQRELTRLSQLEDLHGNHESAKQLREKAEQAKAVTALIERSAEGAELGLNSDDIYTIAANGKKHCDNGQLVPA